MTHASRKTLKKEDGMCDERKKKSDSQQKKKEKILVKSQGFG